MPNKPWSKDEIEQLKILYQNHSVKEIAELLGKSIHSVRWNIHKIGLQGKAQRWSKEEDEILASLFPTKTAEYIRSLLPNRSLGSIYVRAEQKNIKKSSFWTEEEQKRLCNGYTNFDTEEIQKRFPTRSLVAIQIKAGRLLREKNFPRKRIHKHTVNEHFFETLSPESCYWAGFLAADGNVFGNSVKLELQIRDRHHLERFALDTGFEGNIDNITRTFSSGIMGHRSTLNKTYTYSRMRVSSKRWVNDLDVNFNITEKKSLTLKAPDIANLEHSLSYIIGYIDGDGCISFNKNSQKGCWYLSVMGTYDTLSFIKQTLDDLFPYENNNKQASVIKKGKIYIYAVGGERIKRTLSYLKLIEVPKLQRKWGNIK
jgi:hypothetical protein